MPLHMSDFAAFQLGAESTDLLLPRTAPDPYSPPMESGAVAILTTLLADVIAWRRLMWAWRSQTRVPRFLACLTVTGLPTLVVVVLVLLGGRVGPPPVDAIFLTSIVWVLIFVASWLVASRVLPVNT